MHFVQKQILSPLLLEGLCYRHKGIDPKVQIV